MGVIFLTLYIDLIGFSIIFPLMPDMLGHYLRVEGQEGLLGSLMAASDALAGVMGKDRNFAEVLFGGFVSSVFSVMQFLLAPFWGSLSDRIGRRPVLIWTVVGTSFGYLLWAFSSSFWVFLLSRLLSGAFGGNLSVATAAVADVTTRQERSRAMGLVGAAFGLGLVTGPSLGALCSGVSLGGSSGGLFGLHPFSFPALLALGISLVNLIWILLRFKEPLSPELRSQVTPTRRTNAVREILGLEIPEVRRINVVAFIFSVSFVAVEMTLTFLAAERFGYTARQNGILLAFLGVCSILTQGVLVRRLFRVLDENRTLGVGLVVSAIGILWLAFASEPWMLYLAVMLSTVGAGLVNPATTGLISLYAPVSEQGRVLGIFRSLGALSRAITPLLAGVVFWTLGSVSVYVGAAGLALYALILGTSLPRPKRD